MIVDQAAFQDWLHFHNSNISAFQPEDDEDERTDDDKFDLALTAIEDFVYTTFVSANFVWKVDIMLFSVI